MATIIIGCSSSSSSPDLSNEQKHIFHAVELANQYAVANKKQATSMDEVKQWAIAEGKGSAEDFTSTRDSQPYVLVAMEGMGSIVVHEENGKNGKCYVYRLGQVSEIKKEDVPNAIKTAQSMGRPGGMKMNQPGAKPSKGTSPQ